MSEPSVYRTLKAHDPITSPAFIVIRAANEFKDKTIDINQLWQTGFTYLKALGWGYLSAILDDYTRAQAFDRNSLGGVLLDDAQPSRGG